MSVYATAKLGSKIKELRKEKGLSQIQLAEKLGIPKSTMSNYENNFREPNDDTLQSICDILGVSLDELLRIELKSNPDYMIATDDHVMVIEAMTQKTKSKQFDWNEMLHSQIRSTIDKSHIDVELNDEEYKKIVDTVKAAVELELFKMGKVQFHENTQK